MGDIRKTHSGFVMRNCNNGRAFFKIPNQYGYNEYHEKSSRYIHMIGIIFEMILIWIGILYIMKSRSADYVRRTHFYTYKYYGLMCSCTCCSIVTLPIMLYCVNSIAEEMKPENELDLTYYVIGIGVDGFPALFGLFTAIYFAYKTTPPCSHSLHSHVTGHCAVLLLQYKTGQVSCFRDGTVGQFDGTSTTCLSWDKHCICNFS